MDAQIYLQKMKIIQDLFKYVDDDADDQNKFNEILEFNKTRKSCSSPCQPSECSYLLPK